MTAKSTERAPRRERIKRLVWMLGSLGFTFWVVVLSQYPALWLGYDARLGPIVVGFLAVDYLIWQWGVDYFDLVPPKEFREVEQ